MAFEILAIPTMSAEDKNVVFFFTSITYSYLFSMMHPCFEDLHGLERGQNKEKRKEKTTKRQKNKK